MFVNPSTASGDLFAPPWLENRSVNPSVQFSPWRRSTTRQLTATDLQTPRPPFRFVSVVSSRLVSFRRGHVASSRCATAAKKSVLLVPALLSTLRTLDAVGLDHPLHGNLRGYDGDCASGSVAWLWHCPLSSEPLTPGMDALDQCRSFGRPSRRRLWMQRGRQRALESSCCFCRLFHGRRECEPQAATSCARPAHSLSRWSTRLTDMACSSRRLSR
ncbi:hypothetical protein BC567DRAFT_56614 [Phyllosticta citribraziliensis]